MEIRKIKIQDLELDLNNFRSIPQTDEKAAIDTYISISPDSYWALFTSILENGYFGTENIIVLEENEKLIVKEGNRRVSILKIIFGLIPEYTLDDYYLIKIRNLDIDWKSKYEEIPCVIYKENEMKIMNQQIALIHGKDEKAGRDKWKAIAKARFSRDVQNHVEYALDLFEKYLSNCNQISDSTKKRWSGCFPITILDEVILKLSKALMYQSISALINDYPQKNEELINSIIYDIGFEQLSFKEIREDTFLRNDKYSENIFPMSSDIHEQDNTDNSDFCEIIKTQKETRIETNTDNLEPKKKVAGREPLSSSYNDSKSVRKRLRTIKPSGIGFEKIVTIKEEMLQIDISKCPLAFCFLLRSMIEISLKAYKEKNPDSYELVVKSSNGKVTDRKLKEITNDAIGYFEKKDIANQKKLYSSKAVLLSDESIFSVTSLNQLIHNQNFSLCEKDVCIGFNNIFPLIELLSH